MLRDEGRAPETLAKVLASSRYGGQLLERSPASVAVFGTSDARVPLTRAQLAITIRAAIARQDDDDATLLAIRLARRSELIRIAVANLTGALDRDGLELTLTDLMAATLQRLFEVAIRHVEKASDAELSTRITIIGMGRFGSRELGYARDADVVFVHGPAPGVDAQHAQSQVKQVVAFLREGLSVSEPDPAFGVDTNLRPDGKAGPMVRTSAFYVYLLQTLV